MFDWLPALAAAEPFDLVIVDPPSMTSKATQVPAVLAAYRKLYRAAARARRARRRARRRVLHEPDRARGVPADRRARRSATGFSLERDLPPEPDHPVGFPQADYLKIGWWRSRR